MSDIISFTYGFAAHAHKDQKRKYTNTPYINHCLNVKNKLQSLGFSEYILVAAILHDTVEDTNTTPRDIEENFGTIVARLVEYLTDVYTKEAYPDLNRKERKLLETERLSKISSDAKSIKLADLIDNSYSIVDYDPGFARTYLAEREELLDVLEGGDIRLLKEAYEVLDKGKRKISSI